ncbi:DUF4174 domain-containing protein [Bernardetia sp. ABR2-2B]|uniref:DUF4174 domain-containing protein n=1 Tax=Bernardetia sp. ABR2-2B TaxID=3127472 RepID=UPI0030D59531
MKLPIYSSIFILFFLLLSCTFMPTKTDLLDKFQWKNRILIVFSDTKDNSLFQKQMQLFLENKEGLEERDLIVFQVFEEIGIMPSNKTISDTEELKKRFDFSFEENKFAVFLVGKDGGIKLKVENKILTLEKLFGTIDAMPMRQAEMERK